MTVTRRKPGEVVAPSRPAGPRRVSASSSGDEVLLLTQRPAGEALVQEPVLVMAHRPAEVTTPLAGSRPQAPVVDSGGGPAAHREWTRGDVVGGRYEVLGFIGLGALGSVHRLRHRAWSIDLAVKTVRRELTPTDRDVEALVRCCQPWIDLGYHPHVGTCWYVRVIDGLPRIFVDFLAGRTLERALASGSVAGWDGIIDAFLQVLDALAFAHGRGVLHLDLRPANCFVDATGHLRITDLGMAEGLRGLRRPPSGHPRSGTPPYAAPEQWDATRGDEGPWTDLYALGVMLYEAGCGVRPFEGGNEDVDRLRQAHLGTPPPSPTLHRADFPPELAAFVERCLAKSGRDRFPTAEEARRELCRVHKSVLGSPAVRSDPVGADLAADSLNNRGVALLDLGLADAALEKWEEALALDGHHCAALFNRGLARWRRGEIDDETLLADLAQARRHGEDGEVDHLEGLVHMERCDSAGAVECFERAAHARGDDPLALTLLEAARERLEEANRDTGEFQVDPACEVQAMDGGGARSWALAAGQLMLVDAAERTAVRAGDGRAQALAALADGTGVVTALRDTVALWDASGQARVHEVRDYDRITGLCVAPTGRFAAFTSTRNPLDPVVWEIGSDCHVLDAPALEQVRPSLPEECLQALADMVGVTHAHREMEAELRRRLGRSRAAIVLSATARGTRRLPGGTAPLTTLAFSRDGDCLVGGDADGCLRAWDVASARQIATCQHGAPVGHVAFSPCGTSFVSAGGDALRIWSLPEGAETRRLASTHRAALVGVWWTPEGLFTLDRDGGLQMRDVESGRVWRTFRRRTSPVGAVGVDGRAAMFSLGGGRFSTLAFDRSAFRLQAAPALCRVKGAGDAAEAEAARADVAARLEAIDFCLGERDYRQALLRLLEIRAVPGYERSPEVMFRWQQLYRACRKKAFQAAWFLWSLPVHEGRITALALSGDGRVVATGGTDGLVRLLSMPHGAAGRTLDGPWGAPTSLAVNFDGEMVVSGHQDGRARVWDTASGQCRQVLVGESAVEALRISHDDRWVVSAGADGWIRLWDVASGRCVQRIDASDQTGTRLQLFWHSEQGRLISRKSVLRRWSLPSPRPVASLEEPKGLLCAATTGDARVVLLGSSSGNVALWNVVGHYVQGAGRVFDGPIHFATMGPEGRWAVLGGLTASGVHRSGAIRVWDSTTSRTIGEVDGHEGELTALEMTPDGGSLLTAGADGILRVFALDWELELVDIAPGDARLQGLLTDFLLGCTPPVACLPADRLPTVAEVTHALKREGTPRWTPRDLERLMVRAGLVGYGAVDRQVVVQALLAAGGEEGEEEEPPGATARDLSLSPAPVLRRGALRTVGVERILHAHEQGVTAVAIAPEGGRMASASRDGSLRVWSLDDGRVEHTLGRAVGWLPAGSLLFSADGSVLYTGHDDGQVHAWDAAGGSLLATHARLDGAVSAMALGCDGSRMLWAAQGGIVCQWDVTRQEVEHRVATRRESIQAVSFAGGGRFVTADGRSLHVWETGATSPHLELVGHTQPILSLSATPDGRFLLSASQDQTLRLWDLESGECLRVLFETDLEAVASAVLSADARHAVSASAGKLMIWDLREAVRVATTTSPTGGLACLAWSGDGERVLGGGSNGSLALWRLAWDEREPGDEGAWDGSCAGRGSVLLGRAREMREEAGWPACGAMRRFSLAHALSVNVRGLAFLTLSADGERAVTGGRDGRIHVIHLRDGAIERSIRVFKALEWGWTDTYRERILTVDAERDLRTHDALTGDLLTEESCLGMQSPVAVSGDLLTGASGFDSACWQLWDLAAGYSVRVIPGARETLTGIAMRVDGRKVITWSHDGWVQAWDVPSARQQQSVKDPSGTVEGVVFAPDGLSVAWTNGRGEVCIWVPESGTLRSIPVVTDGSRGPTRLGFFPDGTRLLWAGEEHCGILDLASDTSLCTLVGHPARVVAACCGMDGTHVVTASQDGLVKIWALEWEPGALGAPDATVDAIYEQFLCLHARPDQGAGAVRSEDELTAWLRREGETSWTAAELSRLQARLRHAGCGNLAADAVEASLTERKEHRRLAEAASRALLDVAARGAVEELAGLLGNGADPMVRDERGASALHHACAHGHLEIARMLVDAGADVGAEDLEGRTPLYLAAASDAAAVVSFLAEAGGDPSRRDLKGRTPLHAAAAEGHVSVVRVLLAKGADACARSRFVDDERTPLHDAATSGVVEAIEELIRGGADVTGMDVDQRTPLHLVAARGMAHAAERLVALGADVEAVDWAGCTPLHMAAELGHDPVIEVLTRCGAFTDVLDRQSRTPLRAALEGGRTQTARLLVSRGARTDRLSDGERASLGAAGRGGLLAGLGGFFKQKQPAVPEMNQRGETGATALHVALLTRDMKKFRKVLARGGNPNLRDVEGRTPLYLAVKEGNPEIVEALLAAGANVRYRYEKGRTLLHLCARKGDISLARLLLASGAEVNVADSRHRTPLAEAAYRKRMEMMELLLARGADGSVAADDWGTPYEICVKAPNVYEHADRMRYAEMAAMLVAAGQGVEREEAEAVPVEVLTPGALQALGWSGLRQD